MGMMPVPRAGFDPVSPMHRFFEQGTAYAVRARECERSNMVCPFEWGDLKGIGNWFSRVRQNGRVDRRREACVTG